MTYIIKIYSQQERIFSVATVAVMAGAAIVGPGVPLATFGLDLAMGIAIPIHTHWGLEQVKAHNI